MNGGGGGGGDSARNLDDGKENTDRNQEFVEIKSKEQDWDSERETDFDSGGVVMLIQRTKGEWDK